MKTEDALFLLNVPPWWLYTKGRGIKVAVLGTPAGNEWAIPVNYTNETHYHEQGSAYLIKQIAPEAEVYGLAFFDATYKGDWKLTDCLQWCLDNRIDILSMSFSKTKLAQDEALLLKLVQQGCIPFASAGNKGEGGTVWPGRSPHTICVGAYSDVQQGISPGSSIGPEVDMLAPTGLWIPKPGGDGCITYPDTSGAVPVAAGMAALWKALTWGDKAAFEAFIEDNARDLYQPGRDDISGHGLLILPDPSSLEITGKEEPALNQPQYLIIHHSATQQGDAASFRRAHMAQGWRDVGYHYIINNGTYQADGLIETGRPEDMEGAHCTDQDMNRKSIGICLVGDFDQDKPTARQMDSLLTLARQLMDKYSIPPERVLGHKETGAATNCPGRNFDMEGLRAMLTPTATPATPAKTTLKLKVGGKTITRSDGKVFTLDVPARVEDGRTLVPLRAIAEALGAFVHYEDGNITITL